MCETFRQAYQSLISMIFLIPPLVRCGAFNYGCDKDIRRAHPYLFTAAAAEAVFLKRGNQLDFSHGQGTVTVPLQPFDLAVIEKSPFSLKNSHFTNFLTLGGGTLGLRDTATIFNFAYH